MILLLFKGVDNTPLSLKTFFSSNTKDVLIDLTDFFLPINTDYKDERLSSILFESPSTDEAILSC